MKEIILTLVEADKDALASVRCMPGLQAAIYDGLVWVRGIAAEVQPDLAIQQLPSIHTYKLDEENRLFPLGKPTPVATLPALQWLPVRDLIPVVMPSSAMPGRLHQKLEVRLAPSSREEKPMALLSDLESWCGYAENAPSIRLKQVRFAVSAANQVIIVGDPLPPIPGKAYSLKNNLLLPAGYDFDPPALGPLIAMRLNPSNDCLLLFNTDGSCAQLPYSHFVVASRSAVRLTKAGRNHE